VDWWTKQAKGHFVVLPTVYQELEDIARTGMGKAQANAQEALSCITVWGFSEDRISTLQAGFALELAKKLVAQEIVEILGDGLVIAEAAFLGCDAIVSSKPQLIAASQDSLSLALLEADAHVDRVFIISPEAIVHYLSGKTD
jgi:hypothetical protein